MPTDLIRQAFRNRRPAQVGIAKPTDTAGDDFLRSLTAKAHRPAVPGRGLGAERNPDGSIKPSNELDPNGQPTTPPPPAPVNLGQGARGGALAPPEVDNSGASFRAWAEDARTRRLRPALDYRTWQEAEQDR